ncbi:regulatory protein RecX [Marinobacterium arenosum]|uniref:regulatory protein RecX n=1 Tax=Marinobacterium arenosum TaxID=2862496 RepID=UPI001C95A9C8|nr:regulatory protein RecX [Marinobacterium arenosum]MBY4675672.1 recombination regulator RecX [Marinobacterium arenosum]
MSEQEDPRSEIRGQAFRLLARREYSRRELALKFARKYQDADIEAVLDQLVAEGYQSDRRFVELFVRNRVSQLQGLNKIRFDIRQKGIAEQELEEVLQEQAPDWFDLALQARLRRFPQVDRSDRKQLAKQMRHLLQRGFSMEEARYALDAEPDEPDWPT